MPPVTLEGTQLERSIFTESLGVLIENLNFKVQINYIIIKLSRVCGILCRVENSFTPEELVSISYAMLLLFLHIVSQSYHVHGPYLICNTMCK